MLLCTFTYCSYRSDNSSIWWDSSIRWHYGSIWWDSGSSRQDNRSSKLPGSLDSDGSSSSVGCHCVYSHGGCCCTVYCHLVQEVNKQFLISSQNYNGNLCLYDNKKSQSQINRDIILRPLYHAGLYLRQQTKPRGSYVNMSHYFMCQLVCLCCAVPPKHFLLKPMNWCNANLLFMIQLNEVVASMHVWILLYGENDPTHWIVIVHHATLYTASCLRYSSCSHVGPISQRSLWRSVQLMEKLAMMVAMIVTRGKSHMFMNPHMHSDSLTS